MMFQLLQKFNPTASLLRMKSFVSRHDYIFSLLCLLNVNMGKLKQKEMKQFGTTLMLAFDYFRRIYLILPLSQHLKRTRCSKLALLLFSPLPSLSTSTHYFRGL